MRKECETCSDEQFPGVRPAYECQACPSWVCEPPPHYSRTDNQFHGEHCKCCGDFLCELDYKQHVNNKHQGQISNDCFPQLNFLISGPVIGRSMLVLRAHQPEKPRDVFSGEHRASVIRFINHASPGVEALLDAHKILDENEVKYRIDVSSRYEHKMLVPGDAFLYDKARIERVMLIASRVSALAWGSIKHVLPEEVRGKMEWRADFLDKLVERFDVSEVMDLTLAGEDKSWVVDLLMKHFPKNPPVRNDRIWSLLDSGEVPDDSTEMARWLFSPLSVPAEYSIR